MKHKTAVKKLMGLGLSRNEANNKFRYWRSYLRNPVTNLEVVECTRLCHYMATNLYYYIDTKYKSIF